VRLDEVRLGAKAGGGGARLVRGGIVTRHEITSLPRAPCPPPGATLSKIGARGERNVTDPKRLTTEIADAVEAPRRGDGAAERLVHAVPVNPSYPGVSRGAPGRRDPRQRFLAARYAEAGLETYWVAEDPERRNLVGVRRERRRARSSSSTATRHGAARVRGLAVRGSVEPGDPRRPAVRARLDRHEGIRRLDVARRAVAPRRRYELAGDLQLHSVVGEETGEEYDLGTLPA
jgi:hypothetical protein